MKVADIMVTNVVSIHPDTSVMKIGEILDSHKFVGLPVVNEFNVVVGVVTAKDLFTKDLAWHIPTYVRLLGEAKFLKDSKQELPRSAKRLMTTKAQDIMNSNVYFARPEMEVETLAAIAAETLYDPFPVVDQSNVLLGIVTKTDLVKYLSGGRLSPMVVKRHTKRYVDDDLVDVQKDLRNRFAYIATFKANVWLTTGTVLFIVGFLMGMLYVVDPKILGL